jgi:hypothetical protein
MRMRIVAALAVNMTVISHGPTIGQEGDFVARLNAGLDEQIIAMKKQMPIELDQVTKLTDMTRNGFSITYWYKVALPEAKWTQKMREDMFKVYLKQNCLTNEGARLLLDYGYSLRHVVVDEQGTFVGSSLITKSKCSSQ